MMPLLYAFACGTWLCITALDAAAGNARSAVADTLVCMVYGFMAVKEQRKKLFETEHKIAKARE